MVSFEKLCLRWNNHSSNFVGNLGVLLASEDYSDVTICCQGEVWHLHQLVLSASSAHFAQLLRHIPTGQTPILILDGPTANDVNALIHFIYHGEVNVDQDSLPSLLRTASSLKIKGLADVNGLTQDIITCDETSLFEVETTPVPAHNSPCEVGPASGELEEISPLNLSFNKQNCKVKSRKDEELKCLPRLEANDTLRGVRFTEKNESDNLDETYLPSPKRVRTFGPNDVSCFGHSKLEHTKSSSVQGCESNTRHISSVVKNLSMVSSEQSVPKCLETSVVNSVPQKVPTFVNKQQPVEVMNTIPPDMPTSYYNPPISVSFPLLNMALSPNPTYQQSSIVHANVIIHPDSDNSTEMVILNANLSEFPQSSNSYESQTPTKNFNQNVYVQVPHSIVQSQQNAVSYVDSAMEVHQTKNTPDICSINVTERGKSGGSDNNINLESTNMALSMCEVQEKPFNHKKFSACSVSNSFSSKKLTHSGKGLVKEPKLTATNALRIKKEVTKEITAMETELCSKNTSTFSEITSSGSVKLSSVTAPSCLSTLGTVPTSSIVYSSSSPVFISCDISNSTDTLIKHSKSESNCVKVKEDPTLNKSQNQNPFLTQESKEFQDSNSFVSTTQGSAVGTTTDGSTNAQRVTVNMRTFKEEWRRQLLVDYDSRTNMSICMLCFTTFKSYDGPRKNTYVKHAKRFHPALEEYSDEERSVIISMYEKYHKYDIDMQKEINKSFRTTSGAGNSLRRQKLSDSVLNNSVLNSGNLISRLEADGESSEEKDSGCESKATDYNSVTTKSESKICESSAVISSSDKASIQEEEFSINNNNNNNINENNNKCNVSLLSRGTSVAS